MKTIRRMIRLSALLDEALSAASLKEMGRKPFTIVDGLGSHGQTKASSLWHHISGRELLEAGMPKEHLRNAVKSARELKKNIAKGTHKTHMIVGPQGVGVKRDIVIKGKRLDSNNGLDIYYPSDH